jgi:hypothetical protein
MIFPWDSQAVPNRQTAVVPGVPVTSLVPSPRERSPWPWPVPAAAVSPWTSTTRPPGLQGATYRDVGKVMVKIQ